jgi:hypothetical protein
MTGSQMTDVLSRGMPQFYPGGFACYKCAFFCFSCSFGFPGFPIRTLSPFLFVFVYFASFSIILPSFAVSIIFCYFQGGNTSIKNLDASGNI